MMEKFTEKEMEKAIETEAINLAIEIKNILNKHSELVSKIALESIK